VIRNCFDKPRLNLNERCGFAVCAFFEVLEEVAVIDNISSKFIDGRAVNFAYLLCQL